MNQHLRTLLQLLWCLWSFFENLVNYLFFLKPVIAALLALVILGNQISGMQVIAIIVVCGCVAGEMFYAPIRRLFRDVKV